MIAVITGDIINSQKEDPSIWLLELKNAIARYQVNPKLYDIYRGDSFQLEISMHKALEAAIYIKSSIKKIKGLDVKMSIGIGDKTYTAESIKESNGSAFVRSGNCFENLKKRKLAIKSSFPNHDKVLNIMIQLAMLTADRWAPVSAEITQKALIHREYNQNQLATLLKKTQSAISEGLKRSGFEEIKKMLEYYENLASNHADTIT
ncbi:MAG: transcriptional regulator [Reichenbachiella sp.]